MNTSNHAMEPTADRRMTRLKEELRIMKQAPRAPSAVAHLVLVRRKAHMFGKPRNQNQLQPPPIAESEPQAVEVLRVWAAPGSPQQLTLRTTWKDAGAWGLMLVDIARHASKAYASEGQDPNAAIARIRELFDAEWEKVTTEAKDITPR